jgi:hypothetical protein
VWIRYYSGQGYYTDGSITSFSGFLIWLNNSNNFSVQFKGQLNYSFVCTNVFDCDFLELRPMCLNIDILRHSRVKLVLSFRVLRLTFCI